MKQKFILLSIILFGFIGLNAQVLTQNPVYPNIPNSNVAIDFSTNYSKDAGFANHIGKGIVLPSTDLREFEFEFSLVDGATFPTLFDGMIVYNEATGATRTDGNRSAISVSVTPGFYYFHNPDGYEIYQNTYDPKAAIAQGTWMPLGSSSAQITNGKDTLFVTN